MGRTEFLQGLRMMRFSEAYNCVSFEGMKLQIPQDQHRCHYVRATVTVIRRSDGSIALLHGPRKLAEYHQDGCLKTPEIIPQIMEVA